MDTEVAVYELQLSQVQLELSHCSDKDKKKELKMLEDNIKELIKLTKESESSTSPPAGDLDAEYNLFRTELALDENKEETNLEAVNVAVQDLQQDLESLPGMKCQAPFKHSWCDQTVFHNALVFKVDKSDEVRSVEDINVHVMFTNPTHSDMKPCPFFLESECRFSIEKCRFSHGEIVPLVSLKEYKEPDFSTLESGCRALVKQDDGLWYRAIVRSVNNEKCLVKFESNAREEVTDLQNIFPLDGSPEIGQDGPSSDEDSVGDESPEEQPPNDIIDIIHKTPAGTALGGWEQHTTGFGSRMMAQMGYVLGEGLGSKSDGRVEPIPAVVYPTGKSLDHCMMLKEKAGGDQDLFKAERKLRRVQKKHQDAMSRAYEKEKLRTDVFTFLNDRIGQTEKSNSSPTVANSRKNLQNATEKGLNVSSLQICEDVKKIEKEKKKLNESLGRHSASSPAHVAITEKIRECDGRLSALEASERQISSELRQRNNRKKLSVF